MATARVRRAALAAIAVIACTDVIAGVTSVVRPSRVQQGTASARRPAPPPTVPTPAPPPTVPTPTPTQSSTATLTAQHARPDTIWIPAQHVRAPIEVCDIVDDELEPPQDVHHTCYWAGGAALSAAVGTTVVTGHVNWVGQGTGALGNIGRLHRGDLVRTTGRDGIVARWRVTSVVHRPKSQGIDTSVFVGVRSQRLLYLITCGGAFDASDANYLDNIYVRAVPLPPDPAATATSTSRSRQGED